MIKKRKFYTLSDIRKHIVFTPLIFVFLISFIAILVITFVLEFEKKNNTFLYIQEDTYNKETILNEYISDIKYNASSSFDNEEILLNEAVLSLYGYIHYSVQGISKYTIIKKMMEVEKKTNFEFVLFSTEDDSVLYGKEIIDYLKVLTNSNIKMSSFRHHMLKNISYIGTNNLIYWVDTEKRKIRLSYFKKLDNTQYYIGAFSKIDDLKESTRNAILNSIVQKSKYYKDAYFWFYDYNLGYVYNYYNKGQKIDAKFILDQDRLNSSNEILKKYINNETTSSSDIHNFSKYNFLISIKSFSLPNKIAQLKYEYNSKLSIAISIVILIAIFLIVASTLFSKFINKIFHRYNKRLETRNIMYKKWKERYELAIIASNDGLWDIDLKTKHIYFSKKWLDMFGYEDGDINNLDEWFDLIHYEDRQLVMDKFNKHLNGDSENFVCEYRIKNKNNKFKWILVRGKAFNDNNHKRMLMMSMDIEQRKKLIKELKYVDLLVEYGRIVIFKWKNDENLSVDYISKSISSYGYSAQEFQSKEVSYFDFVHEDDIKELKEDLAKAVNNDERSFTKVYRVKDKNGDVRWVFTRTIFLKDDFGNVAYFYGYISDITEMKLTEEELKHKVDEEVEKNIEKDRILVHQSKLAAMGEMLGNIAHQWRQPLNNINLLTHFIRDSYGTLSKEELDSVIKDTKLQIEYMSQTIDDFRNFYQPNKDKVKFNVKDSILQCSKIVETQFEKNNIELNITGEDVETVNYMNELQQVVLNILNNAADAAIIKKQIADFDAKVDVEIFIDYGNKIKIVLENNCGKIEDEVMDRMFEPYFTTKFENQGTGIGLYMAKTIIEKNMGGKIFAKNKNDGVIFVIILPLSYY
ncbi:PAS domain-containing sensor histidine kinase [Arcobacter arenosus]|jgi:PAS domain S-box-containing protein|uniref:histidine kinase n=1 Tax=Arcobacter arenosus TaxID=2576037 RepID=A0A5R8Y1M2_9BACT|nr:PAS domain-containing sensor histidine kinase [Arcobacter arenosus]TLP38503.1 PAS domain S-box protein [Arcobacter arenosus]